jgi:YVTN family beta-propeller protein
LWIKLAPKGNPLNPRCTAAAALLAGLATITTAAPRPHFEAPAGSLPARIDRTGTTVLPNGRLLTPTGRQIQTAPGCYGLHLSRDGSVLVSVNGGTGPFSLTVIRDPQSSAPRVSQIPPAPLTDKQVLPSVFLGAAVDTARGVVYASGGNSGGIVVFALADGQRLGEMPLDGGGYADSFPTDIALAPDRAHLYALDLANYRLAVVNLETSRVEASVGVGRQPFAVRLSPDGCRAYVANMGTFQYSLVEEADGMDTRGLAFPPFGYPSREAREGTRAEGRQVPGLGDPNAPESCSVWAVDLSDPARPRIAARIRTGARIGDEAGGGSAPVGIAVTTDTVFVTNSTNDTVEAYDTRTHARRWRTLLAPQPLLRELRGVMPFGVAVSPDGGRLFVAESGINALAVLDARTGKVLGHAPTCWYPAGVCVSPDGGAIYVSNAKGWGSGPNGGAGFQPGPEGSFIGRLMKGAVSIISSAELARLDATTSRVLANNGMHPSASARPASHPVPHATGKPSAQIRHVFVITKENRTFDEVFGDMPGAAGDPSLARFGVDRDVRGSTETIPDAPRATVTPNHRALARRFALCDNFFLESDVSADGHRWLVGVYANHWVNTITAAGYGGGAKFRRVAAPGRLALFGSNSALTPEDYLEDGALWEHLARHRVPFFNYGEGFEFAGAEQDGDTKPTGIRLPVNIPMPAALHCRTHRAYPSFNMFIPDQYRADVFVRDFRDRYESGREPLPGLVYIYLPGDHGADERPATGYPYLESFMADNDLALGRIVEALSRSRFWPHMAVFVTEDDPQSGVDHMDAHRSFLLAISPWARRGHVSRAHTSIPSMFKTAYAVLGMPPLNLCDAVATDLGDCFAEAADPEPYAALPVDPRLFDPEKARDPSDPEYTKAASQDTTMLDGVPEALRQLPGR